MERETDRYIGLLKDSYLGLKDSVKEKPRPISRSSRPRQLQVMFF